MSTPTAAPPFEELQVKLFTALNGVISAPVYDNPPEGTSKPYVTIGEVFGTPDNWHGGFGWEIVATIHVWTKTRGYRPAIQIAEEIIPILDHKRDALNLASNWDVVSIRFEQMLTLRDPDPEIRHVPVQFRIVIQQEV